MPPAPKAGRLPVSAALLFVAAGLTTTIALLCLAVNLDPEKDEGAALVAPAAICGLLALLLIWSGVRRTRRTFGWTAGATAVLGGGVVLATIGFVVGVGG